MSFLGAIASVAKAAYVGVKKIFSGIWNFGKTVFNAIQQALQAFLQKARDFLRNVIQKIRIKIVGALVGAAHVIKRMGNNCVEMSRNFSVDSELGTWKVTTVKREISENELPPSIREKLNLEGEVNNTKELNEALVC